METGNGLQSIFIALFAVLSVLRSCNGDTTEMVFIVILYGGLLIAGISPRRPFRVGGRNERE
jgi:hypothetical protein